MQHKLSKIKNIIIKKTIYKKRLLLLEQKKQLYKEISENSDKAKFQLARFNLIWQYCYQHIPFYKQWSMRHKLPKEIKSLKELGEFPALTKQHIQEAQALIFQSGRIKHSISTGGSTGEPTKFPNDPNDMTPYANMYLGRSWWGIQPLSNNLMIWGHSHLFGQGINGKINQYKRGLYDKIINTTRLNAYNMSVENLEQYVFCLKQIKPIFIIGYTSCLYKMGKYIRENAIDIGQQNQLKGIIVTSETVTISDIDLLQQVFGVPVIIEYGMAETGVIASTYKNHQFLQLYWDSFIGTTYTGRYPVLNITTIHDKLFPLINYRTDDIVNIAEEIDGSIIRLSAVKGRKRDILRIKTKKGGMLELSGILMIHILKSYPQIMSIQFEQLKGDIIKINLVSRKMLDLDNVKAFFIREIRKDHPNIDINAFRISQIKKIELTEAGKEKHVL
jgi:phenylacetate-coenzyme A ligase PaaK-like adenylate-forming protein